MAKMQPTVMSAANTTNPQMKLLRVDMQGRLTAPCRSTGVGGVVVAHCRSRFRSSMNAFGVLADLHRIIGAGSRGAESRHPCGSGESFLSLL